MSEIYTVEATDRTPKVQFDFNAGRIFIGGVSRPENGVGFYVDLMNQLDRFTESKTNALHLDLELEYFNSQSSKSLYQLVKKLKEIVPPKDVSIRWKYDGEDENIEDFAALIHEDLGLTTELVKA